MRRGNNFDELNPHFFLFNRSKYIIFLPFSLWVLSYHFQVEHTVVPSNSSFFRFFQYYYDKKQVVILPKYKIMMSSLNV